MCKDNCFPNILTETKFMLPFVPTVEMCDNCYAPGLYLTVDWPWVLFRSSYFRLPVKHKWGKKTKDGIICRYPLTYWERTTNSISISKKNRTHGCCLFWRNKNSIKWKKEETKSCIFAIFHFFQKIVQLKKVVLGFYEVYWSTELKAKEKDPFWCAILEYKIQFCQSLAAYHANSPVSFQTNPDLNWSSKQQSCKDFEVRNAPKKI